MFAIAMPVFSFPNEFSSGCLFSVVACLGLPTELLVLSYVLLRVSVFPALGVCPMLLCLGALVSGLFGWVLCLGLV